MQEIHNAVSEDLSENLLPPILQRPGSILHINVGVYEYDMPVVVLMVNNKSAVIPLERALV